jgi:HEPN domain-containing protein
MKPLTHEWIEKAEEDYRVAKREQQTRPAAYSAVCFHAQQCVEKYLKAFLQEQELVFQRTHDLEVLMKLGLPFVPALETHRESLQWLTAFAVEVRYPGMRANKKDAERCVQIATSLRSLIRRQLSGKKKQTGNKAHDEV